MATFAEGFGKGIIPGVYLSREMRERGQARSTREMAEVLAEFQSDDPYAGAFDATQQAVPEDGQTQRNPNQGFSGNHYAELRDRFYKAAVNSGNLDEYKKADELWSITRQGKINDAGMAAVAAYDRGDMEGAKKMLLTASAYTAPGITPQATIDPKSGAFIIANYDSKGNPVGGMAMTRDDLVDLVNFNNDPQAWSESNWTKQYQGGQLDALRKRDAQAVNMDNWEVHFKQGEAERAAELQAVQVAAEKAQQRANESAARVAEATESGAIEVGKKANLVASAEADAKLAELARAKSDKAVSTFLSWNTASRKEMEANRKAIMEGGAGPTAPQLLQRESGGNWAAKNYEVGSSGRIGHFGRAQFGLDRLDEARAAGVLDPNMTPEEFASDTPAGRAAQVAVESWHWNDIENFIKRQGLDKFVGQADAAGTPITMDGMKFAAHIGGKTGMLNWVRNGKYVDDVNGNGPAEYMKLAVAPPVPGQPAQPGQGAIPAEGAYDPVTQAITTPEEGKGKEEEDQMVLHPYLMDEPDETGFAGPRAGILTLANELSQNLNENNPDATEEDIAHILHKTFGPRQTSTWKQNPETGEITISDGLNSLVVDNSEEVVGKIMQFREDEKETLQAMMPYGERYPAREPAPLAPPLPEQSPIAPPAGARPTVMPAPTVSGIGGGGGAPAGAIPEPAPQQPGIPGGGAQAGGIPAAVDDTAVRTPAVAAPAQPAAVSAISTVPALAPLVEAWRFRGAPPAGPERQQLLMVVEQLDPDTKARVMQELEQISLATRREKVAR